MDNLLIIGAGQYGIMLKELLMSQGLFDRIDFLDDKNEIAIGKVSDYARFNDSYQFAVVAIGNADIRLEMTDKLKAAGYKIASFVSDRAYVSPSAKISEGCIIEPMSAVNTSSELGRCTLVSSGAVINHNSIVGEGCHINCNATVQSNSKVPPKTKVDYNEIF